MQVFHTDKVRCSTYPSNLQRVSKLKEVSDVAVIVSTSLYGLLVSQPCKERIQKSLAFFFAYAAYAFYVLTHNFR